MSKNSSLHYIPCECGSIEHTILVLDRKDWVTLSVPLCCGGTMTKGLKRFKYIFMKKIPFCIDVHISDENKKAFEILGKIIFKQSIPVEYDDDLPGLNWITVDYMVERNRFRLRDWWDLLYYGIVFKRLEIVIDDKDIYEYIDHLN